MVPYRKRHKKLMSEINVVPYIDVMLVLLVIFMITAPLLSQGVKVDLPQAASQPVESQDQETLVVTVDREGRYYLDDRRISSEELRRKVAAILRLRPKTPVLIRGDRTATYGEVVKAMPKDNKVIVSGVNVHARHRKPDQANPQGGCAERGAADRAAAIEELKLILKCLIRRLTQIYIKMNADRKRNRITYLRLSYSSSAFICGCFGFLF